MFGLKKRMETTIFVRNIVFDVFLVASEDFQIKI